MSSLHQQTSWLCSVPATKSINQLSKSKPIYFAPLFKSRKFLAFSADNSKEPAAAEGRRLEESKSNTTRINLAFEKARKYKKSKEEDVIQDPDPVAAKSIEDERLPVQNLMVGDKDVAKQELVSGPIDKPSDYQNNQPLPTTSNSGDGDSEVPDAVKIAMGKASEYKKNKILGPSSLSQGSMGGVPSNGRDGTIKKNTNKKEDIKISSIDFVGLSFADKKSGRGLPAGLVPIADPYLDGDLQEVEIIVGDASMFGNATTPETAKNSDESSDLYKPKVSTWGMFPRPSNISETFGGGRTIRPGEALETAEDRAVREAKTRQLLAAYKRKMGLNLDPKLIAECKKALNDGDSLMDRGRLKDALPYYQQVMDKLPFQTELHGLAALQWSICQDSQTRAEEARIMYEKLQSHPNGKVSKKARQFVFSFQAMEMMKVAQSSVSPINTGLGSYLEAFVEEKVDYTTSGSMDDANEDAVYQALPYIIIFLASPILLVLLAAAKKGM